MIRRIQRGVFSIKSNETTITLSGFTNLNKMIVLLNGGSYYDYSDTDLGSAAYIQNLSLKQLVIESVNKNISLFEGSYQVIEFY